MVAIKYSESLYNSKDIKMFAKAYLEVLPKGISMLVASGSSGCAIASAMIAITNRKLRTLIIRKPGEKSHSFCAGYGYVVKGKAVIVDDFIYSGRTIKRILKFIKKHNICLDIKAIIVDHGCYYGKEDIKTIHPRYI